MLQEVHYNLNNWVGFLGIHFEVGGGGGGVKLPAPPV